VQRTRTRRLWQLFGRFAGCIALPRELEERLGDEVESLVLDLAMHVAPTAQAELLCNLGDGETLAGELQIRRDVVDAAVRDAECPC
jgi:hypothetical protein